MFAIIKTVIDKDSVKSGKYVPQKIEVIKESPFDQDIQKDFFKPAAMLLHQIRSKL